MSKSLSFWTKFLRIGHSFKHTHCMHTYMHPPALGSLFWRSGTFLFWLQGPHSTKQCNTSYYAPTSMHALDSSSALCICERAALLCGTLAKKDRFLLDSSMMN